MPKSLITDLFKPTLQLVNLLSLEAVYLTHEFGMIWAFILMKEDWEV